MSSERRPCLALQNWKRISGPKEGGYLLVGGVNIQVGRHGSDITGSDHRALQAAVDYVASLGGGTVEVGPGIYVMRNSLHLRSNVTVRGRGHQTELRKCAGATSALVVDGDYGEEQVTVADGDLFEVGDGVAVEDDRADGFHITVATIIGRDGPVLFLDSPLRADCMVRRHARAKLTFPVISGYYVQNARVESIAVQGNKRENPPLNGCRGAGIFLYRSHGAQVVDCTVRDYAGDGMSFQQSDDVLIEGCECVGNTDKGIHPGSGSGRPVVRRCRVMDSGNIGLFLCWRVREGHFEDNVITTSRQAGISIGHKDTDNVFRGNTVADNGLFGVHFRPESDPMAGHRNHFYGNRILNNGSAEQGFGVYIDGETRDLVFVNNKISDTRPSEAKKQRIGIFAGPSVRGVQLQVNDLEGNLEAGVIESCAGSVLSLSST